MDDKSTDLNLSRLGTDRVSYTLNIDRGSRRRLDLVAARTGLSRSELVRRILDLGLDVAESQLVSASENPAGQGEPPTLTGPTNEGDVT